MGIKGSGIIFILPKYDINKDFILILKWRVSVYTLNFTGVYSIEILTHFFAFMKSEGIQLGLFKIHQNLEVFDWDFKKCYKI